jgi:transcriptional regulator with XRE-family HTH domain
MTQQQMAELIGVTYQQAHKYEKGINRVAGGRLYVIAQALGVEVSYFFAGMSAEADALEPTPKQRLLLELTRNFTNITSLRQQEAICSLTRALARSDLHEGSEPDGSRVAVIGDNTTAT